MTIREAVSAGAEILRGVPELAGNAARDAEWLLLQQLSLPRAGLRAHPARELSQDERRVYKGRIARRLCAEPVQYITGEQDFFGLDLQVTPAVLIPRPETELLVERVLAALPKDRQTRIVDVGTGSGAIAIALAVHLPAAEVTAVDLSEEALAVARANAERHQVGKRIRFLRSDLLGAVAVERFDIVVSNPPYVPVEDRALLHPQVREFEPALALFAGVGGLDIYRRLIPAALEVLIPGGLLALEIGFDQRDAIAALLEGWTGISFHDDLQGIPRVALARKAVLQQARRGV